MYIGDPFPSKCHACGQKLPSEYKCVRCGKTSLFGSTTISSENIEFICNDCHEKENTVVWKGETNAK